MKYDLECQYCGDKQTINAYHQSQIEHAVCIKCKDSSLTVREHKEKVDYYQGSPAFQDPIKKPETPKVMPKELASDQDKTKEVERPEDTGGEFDMFRLFKGIP